MAFFSFGKKDKNPSQPPDPVAKTPPGTPPQIQTPPADAVPAGVAVPPPVSGVTPSIKPPQPSGLMPAVGLPKNTVTTQPMSMPARPAAPPVPTQKKSTQRLVVTANAAGKMASTAPMPNATKAGASVNLPAGMLLRCLPSDLLAAPLSEFEASGAAAVEIPLPMNAIISQLPSGKVEMPARDLIAHLPPNFLKPEREIVSQLGTLVTLPLMDVVMRIPPDLLAVRPDQKDVDPNVRRMADPFAGEPAPPTEARIVEESQVPPTEEFVPQASQPVPRPVPIPSPTATQQTPSFVPPPRNTAAPPLLAQTGSLSGRPGPVRGTSPMPGRILPAENPVSAPPPSRASTLSASQTLGVPRSPTPTPLIGATASGPIEPRVFPQVPPVPPPGSTAPATPPKPSSSVAVTTPMPRSAFPTPPVPTMAPPVTDAEELKRLAALASAELQDRPATAPVPSVTEAKAEPKPKPDVAGKVAPEQSEPEPGQFAFKAPKRPTPMAPVAAPGPMASTTPLVPAVPSISAFEKPAPPVAATSRFRMPDTVREAAQTTPIIPVPTETLPTSRTTRFTPPAPVGTPFPITESQILPSNPPPATAINLNNCVADDLMPIPGMTRALAVAIVAHRDKLGEFHKLEELLDVPGMTRDIYSNLTGETPSSGVHPSINELLGFPPEEELSLKDVTERICCWPDVTGCLLSQKNGLHLVGTAPEFLDKEAIVAFAPRMFEDVNKSFIEITGKQTDELTIPTTGTSFHLLREKDLYMIILSRLPLMPERHLKIARFVLAGLSSRPS